MRSSTSTNLARPIARLTLSLAAITLALAGCSPPGKAAGNKGRGLPVATPSPVQATPTPAATEAGSHILGKKDFTLRGKPACKIDFAYAAHEPEDLFWEEPCSAVTAKLVTQADLEAPDRWDRLDDFARKFVAALPGGRVLYVEGSFSASVYPVGTTGETYEVAVAD